MTGKKILKKKETDFYSEGLNFSDDPEDSFYATKENEETTQKKTSNKKELFGFYTWEFAVIVIEIVLLVYFAFVLLGLAPLL